ncbi:MAG: HepT-like ribonuclease domain-containing protein [Bryobacteraceae bacterium]
MPEELKDRHPEIDWLGVGAAGNVYRHEYEAVDDALLWHSVELFASLIVEQSPVGQMVVASSPAWGARSPV